MTIVDDNLVQSIANQYCCSGARIEMLEYSLDNYRYRLFWDAIHKKLDFDGALDEVSSELHQRMLEHFASYKDRLQELLEQKTLKLNPRMVTDND